MPLLRVHRKLNTALSLLALSFVVYLPSAYAERYALMIGIGSYKAVPPLEGPVNDVTAFSDYLQRYWQFPKNNVQLLLNESATRDGILAALNQLLKKGKSGDEFLVYFSGHGTSAWDNKLTTNLPTTTGAFIPYDITTVDNLDQLQQTLIVGYRDLRPIFTKLDHQGKHVFVVMDACFSGNTIRGSSSLPNRSVPLDSLVNRNVSRADKAPAPVKEIFDPRYPYNNIYYLSASGENEPAQDIPQQFLESYPTIDGKPHGAFTDSLLRFMGHDYQADLDRDGVVTYRELKSAVREFMWRRGYSHAPQSLPKLEEDVHQLASLPLFGSESASVGYQSPGENQPSAANKPIELRANKDKEANKDVYDIPPKVTLSEYKGVPIIVTDTGDLVGEVKQGDPQKVINNYVTIHELVNGPFVRDFSLEMDLLGIGKSSTLTLGETIGFSIRSEKAVYIMLVSINSHGEITILYPYSLDELKPFPANDIIRFENLARVDPPFGRDHVLVFGFSKLHDQMAILAGKRFNQHSPFMVFFQQLLFETDGLKSRTAVDFFTVAK